MDENQQSSLRPGSTLLGVWAHPDDEAYLSTGLMARVVATGGRVVCCYATRGEAGTDDPVAWPPERLAAHRIVELRAAMSTIGVHVFEFLGHRDGACDTIDDASGAAAVAAVLQRVRPDAVVTFGPDGITGHPDHCAVSRWVTRAWCAERTRRLLAPELLYATVTHEFLDRNAELHRLIGLFSYGPAVPTGESDLAVSVRLDDDELDLKRRVLAAHHSQTAALASSIGERRYRQWWSAESFRRPTPAELGLEMASAV